MPKAPGLPLAGARVLLGSMVVVLLCSAAGCAAWRPMDTVQSVFWTSDYETAERLRASTGRPLLVQYLDTRSIYDKPFNKALQQATSQSATSGFLHCRLFRPYEPDRRYVAQFGVERAPALILVHADGTYHAYTGAGDAEAIARFLNDSQPPGLHATTNLLIPRQPDYAWHDSLDAALDHAAREGNGTLVVLYRWWQRDWERIEPMLARPEVYRRVAGLIHCKVTGMAGNPTAEMERFGVTQLPAIVLVRADGTYEALSVPTGYEAVVRFVDRALRGEREAAATLQDVAP